MNLKPAFAAVLAATAFLALLSATGQDSGTTNAVEMNIHRPLPVPDRVILNVTTDPGACRKGADHAGESRARHR